MVSNTSKGQDTSWEYLDPKGNLQGPFQAKKMLMWHLRKYFNKDTQVRQFGDKHWRLLSTMLPDLERQAATSEDDPEPLATPVPESGTPASPARHKVDFEQLRLNTAMTTLLFTAGRKNLEDAPYWYYQDYTNAIQGPFSAATTIAWCAKGEYKSTLLMCGCENDVPKTLSVPSQIFAPLQDLLQATNRGRTYTPWTRTDLLRFGGTEKPIPQRHPARPDRDPRYANARQHVPQHIHPSGIPEEALIDRAAQHKPARVEEPFWSTNAVSGRAQGSGLQVARHQAMAGHGGHPLNAALTGMGVQPGADVWYDDQYERRGLHFMHDDRLVPQRQHPRSRLDAIARNGYGNPQQAQEVRHPAGAQAHVNRLEMAHACNPQLDAMLMRERAHDNGDVHSRLGVQPGVHPNYAQKHRAAQGAVDTLQSVAALHAANKQAHDIAKDLHLQEEHYHVQPKVARDLHQHGPMAFPHQQGPTDMTGLGALQYTAKLNTFKPAKPGLNEDMMARARALQPEHQKRLDTPTILVDNLSLYKLSQGGGMLEGTHFHPAAPSHFGRVNAPSARQEAQTGGGEGTTLHDAVEEGAHLKIVPKSVCNLSQTLHASNQARPSSTQQLTTGKDSMSPAHVISQPKALDSSMGDHEPGHVGAVSVIYDSVAPVDNVAELSAFKSTDNDSAGIGVQKPADLAQKVFVEGSLNKVQEKADSLTGQKGSDKLLTGMWDTSLWHETSDTWTNETMEAMKKAMQANWK